MRLPAAISSPAPTAITAVPAATTAASTTASAAPASSATASEAASPASSACAAASAFTRWPGFIDDNVASHEIVTVQCLNGALRLFVAIHFHKPEPPRLARKAIANQGDIGRCDSRLRK